MQMDGQETRIPWNRWLVLVLSGLLIGGGAILPGISGGVLSVVFGIYRPMMELLSHPRRALPKYWRVFLPVCVGWVLGFLFFARVIDLVFSANETLATWLFIGLIAGTVPSLYREAGQQGRPKGSFVALTIAFAALFGLLLWVRTSPFAQVAPSWGWYLFAGVLWGLSLIVPGMSSSSILMSLGLFQPLAAGIADFDLSVISFWILGLIVTVLALARLTNHLFERHYALAYHAVVGIVLASTLIIVPFSYDGAKSVILSLVCFAAGFAGALLLDRLDKGKPAQQAEPLEEAKGRDA